MKRISAPSEVVRISSNGRLGAVGEYYRSNALDQVAADRTLPMIPDWDAAQLEMAYLIADPSNRFDANAVAVYMHVSAGHCVLVGFLPKQNAVGWSPLVRRLAARSGSAVGVPAALYRDRDGRNYQVVLRVGEPDRAEMQNTPHGARVLLAERAVAVVGEQHHQDVLAPLADDGRPAWATLHPIQVSAGKYEGQWTLEVRVNGARVGELTALQGSRYLDIAGSEDVVCEASFDHGAKKIEVQLMLPRIDEGT